MTSAVERTRSTFGYSFVIVQRAIPQTLTLWHDGRILLTPPANTGIPAAPTDPGVIRSTSAWRSAR